MSYSITRELRIIRIDNFNQSNFKSLRSKPNYFVEISCVLIYYFNYLY